jgi:hypothetical protein
MPSALAHISHIPKSWHSKRSHHVWPSCLIVCTHSL